MAKTRQKKEQELTNLNASFKRSQASAFIQYLGLTVMEMQELRQTLRSQECELVVAKKNLLGLMLEQGGVADARATTAAMDGGVAIVFGFQDEIAPAKVVADFAKKHDMVRFFGGLLEGRFMNAEEMDALACIPSRQELYAQFVGSVRSPLSGLMGVLQGPMCGLCSVLQQRAQASS